MKKGILHINFLLFAALLLSVCFCLGSCSEAEELWMRAKAAAGEAVDAVEKVLTPLKIVPAEVTEAATEPPQTEPPAPETEELPPETDAVPETEAPEPPPEVAAGRNIIVGGALKKLGYQGVLSSNDSYTVTAGCRISEKSASYTVWANVDSAPAFPKGIPAGEALWINIDKDIYPALYDSVTVEFDYCYLTDGSDIFAGDKICIKISWDGGKSWSEPFYDIAFALSGETLLQDKGSSGVIYNCASSDISGLVPEGERITDIRIMPFGDGENAEMSKLRGGGFRLLELYVCGYSGAPAQLPASYAASYVTADPTMLRLNAYSQMKLMSSVKWTPDKDIQAFVNRGNGEYGRFVYEAGTTYTGLPYLTGRGSVMEFMSALSDDLVYTVPDSGAVGFDSVSAIVTALSKAVPIKADNAAELLYSCGKNGTVPLGSYAFDMSRTSTAVIISESDEQAVYNSYALLDTADILLSVNSVGRAVMASAKPAVAYLEGGEIDPANSFVTVIGNLGELSDGSCWREFSISFAELRDGYYIPLTCVGFASGEIPSGEVIPLGLSSAETLSSGLDGILYSDYGIDAVMLSVYPVIVEEEPEGDEDSDGGDEDSEGNDDSEQADEEENTADAEDYAANEAPEDTDYSAGTEPDAEEEIDAAALLKEIFAGYFVTAEELPPALYSAVFYPDNRFAALEYYDKNDAVISSLPIGSEYRIIVRAVSSFGTETIVLDSLFTR